jgi:wyosine [tRNA(Phe)-imidazoG37] synthetase (radical SAM superfamily)
MPPFFGTECFAPSGARFYGPVDLPGRGRSLGVSLSPTRSRVCSFDCIYCGVDPAPGERHGVRWPSRGDIESELANALPRMGAIDWITVSGRGEPTVHPRFCGVASAVLAVSARARPPVRARIFTNGTGAVHTEVRRILELFDERVIRIDPSPGAVNRPATHFPAGSVVSALTMLSDISVQSCLVDGQVSNIDSESLHEWAELLAELQPRHVALYTIPGPRFDCHIKPVAQSRLVEIGSELSEAIGVPTEVLRYN